MKSIKILVICLCLSACHNLQQDYNNQDTESSIALRSDSLVNGNAPNDTVNSLQHVSNPIAYFIKHLLFNTKKIALKMNFGFM